MRPGAVGFLGSTGGITDDGRLIVIARFESEDAAAENGRRSEQEAWWQETEPAFEGELAFTNCHEVDVFLGGGSDVAGFVQVMYFTSEAEARAAEAAPDAEAEGLDDWSALIDGDIEFVDLREPMFD